MNRSRIFPLLQRQLTRSTRPRNLHTVDRVSLLSITNRSQTVRASPQQFQARAFSISTAQYARPPTADALMENLTELYSTAKDEFEIAAEETEKKTVYAADDREAAKEALDVLKKAYEKAIRESDPETAKQVQSRTGPRIKELENALLAVEEMAMED